MKDLTNLLKNYELIDVFFPYMSDGAQKELDQLIIDHQLEDDPQGIFEKISKDRFFVLTFTDMKHERDSSGDHFSLYRRKMNSVVG